MTMKIFYYFIQQAPEISFTTLNFDAYINLLADNILMAIVFFLGTIALSFICYYSINLLILFINPFVRFNSEQDSIVPIEESPNI